MPEASPASSPVDEYRNAVQGVRTIAKWVAGTLGAVGAVLVTGLGLSSLANLGETALLVFAILGIAVALIGVAWGISQTAAVLRPSTVTFADVVCAETRTGDKGYLQDVIDARAGLLAGLAQSFEEMQTKTQDVMTKRVEALEANYADPTSETKATQAQAAQARAKLYGQKIDEVVARAAYGQVVSRLSVARQLLAGGLVAIGVGLFAVMPALPTDPPPDFHGAELKRTDLSGTSLVGADFSGMKLTRVNFRDADLRDADFTDSVFERVDLEGASVESARFDGVKWRRTTCPDGASSARAGQQCNHHLDHE